MEEMNTNTTTTTENTTEETKTYTQEEVDAILQEKEAEKDRKVSEGINTFKKNYLKEQEKKNSLKSLDDNARALQELKDSKESLEAELAQMKVEKARSDLKSTLAARGLDSRFADLLNITDDNDVNVQTIANFDKLFKTAVNAEVRKRIDSEVPKTSTTTTLTDNANIRNLSIAELAALSSDEFDKLTKK